VQRRTVHAQGLSPGDFIGRAPIRSLAELESQVDEVRDFPAGNVRVEDRVAALEQHVNELMADLDQRESTTHYTVQILIAVTTGAVGGGILVAVFEAHRLMKQILLRPVDATPPEKASTSR
jgi:hypothetical protein